MAPYFPLRWESTGEQWWYASPIDCAAANGHYDLVRELLYIDTNLLIKLTSLRRIWRLETVWDDHDHFNHVAKCRAYVAKNLLLECEQVEPGRNSLIRAGYGGWLLYTAASAGDVGFVQELLERDPFLVFGEGEYGITDVLYAAARSRCTQAFRLLMEFAMGMRGFEEGEACDGFRWEIMNRAVHCAARGGNLEVLMEVLVGGGPHVLAYRDAQGSTILHSAAGRGQAEVVKELIASYNIIDATDHQGNTALHIAAYRGFLPVVETLVAASPSLASSTNKEGNTLLHMAVAGFQAPGFHRLDQQLELMRQLVSGKIINIQGIANSRNNQGRTALHLSVDESIQSDVVELLITVPFIELNIKDADGMTPMDLLKRHPQSGSYKLLIKQMIAAGGIVPCREYYAARGGLSDFAIHLKLQGSVGSSPGVSFRVPDSEIFLYAGNEDNDGGWEASCSNGESSRHSAYSGEVLSQGQSGTKRLNKSRNSVAVRLKVLLQWPKRKDKASSDASELDMLTRSLDETPTPLRHRYSTNSSLPNNKRAIPTKPESPSPSAKKNFTASLMQGVLLQQPKPRLINSSAHSPSSPFSRSYMSSLASADKTKGVNVINNSIASPCSSEGACNDSGESKLLKRSKSLVYKKSMNHYLCFGAQGLVLEDSIGYRRPPGHFQGNSLSLYHYV